ncbi:MAG: hypothetical protein ACK5O7_04535 [Holosporales bacterium]
MQKKQAHKVKNRGRRRSVGRSVAKTLGLALMGAAVIPVQASEVRENIVESRTATSPKTKSRTSSQRQTRQDEAQLFSPLAASSQLDCTRPIVPQLREWGADNLHLHDTVYAAALACQMGYNTNYQESHEGLIKLGYEEFEESEADAHGLKAVALKKPGSHIILAFRGTFLDEAHPRLQNLTADLAILMHGLQRIDEEQLTRSLHCIFERALGLTESKSSLITTGLIGAYKIFLSPVESDAVMAKKKREAAKGAKETFDLTGFFDYVPTAVYLAEKMGSFGFLNGLEPEKKEELKKVFEVLSDPKTRSNYVLGNLFRDGRAFMDKILSMEDWADLPIILTGHSLGGLVAATLGTKLKLNTITFNGPGGEANFAETLANDSLLESVWNTSSWGLSKQRLTEWWSRKAAKSLDGVSGRDHILAIKRASDIVGTFGHFSGEEFDLPDYEKSLRGQVVAKTREMYDIAEFSLEKMDDVAARVAQWRDLHTALEGNSGPIKGLKKDLFVKAEGALGVLGNFPALKSMGAEKFKRIHEKYQGATTAHSATELENMAESMLQNHALIPMIHDISFERHCRGFEVTQTERTSAYAILGQRELLRRDLDIADPSAAHKLSYNQPKVEALSEAYKILTPLTNKDKNPIEEDFTLVGKALTGKAFKESLASVAGHWGDLSAQELLNGDHLKRVGTVKSKMYEAVQRIEELIQQANLQREAYNAYLGLQAKVRGYGLLSFDASKVEQVRALDGDALVGATSSLLRRHVDNANQTKIKDLISSVQQGKTSNPQDQDNLIAVLSLLKPASVLTQAEQLAKTEEDLRQQQSQFEKDTRPVLEKLDVPTSVKTYTQIRNTLKSRWADLTTRMALNETQLSELKVREEAYEKLISTVGDDVLKTVFPGTVYGHYGALSQSLSQVQPVRVDAGPAPLEGDSLGISGQSPSWTDFQRLTQAEEALVSVSAKLTKSEEELKNQTALLSQLGKELHEKTQKLEHKRSQEVAKLKSLHGSVLQLKAWVESHQSLLGTAKKLEENLNAVNAVIAKKNSELGMWALTRGYKTESLGLQEVDALMQLSRLQQEVEGLLDLNLADDLSWQNLPQAQKAFAAIPNLEKRLGEATQGLSKWGQEAEVANLSAKLESRLEQLRQRLLEVSQ